MEGAMSILPEIGSQTLRLRSTFLVPYQYRIGRAFHLLRLFTNGLNFWYLHTMTSVAQTAYVSSIGTRAELAERWTELPQVSDESRSFFRVHTGYFSNIPKCIKAEFIASWACSQSSVVSSSKR
ncbi:hypothetical protein TNCV_2771471 [Trichonephila clavipes]|nr:hypothetical protein TNCV_2771471 [Trichonephila clavipes]